MNAENGNPEPEREPGKRPNPRAALSALARHALGRPGRRPGPRVLVILAIMVGAALALAPCLELPGPAPTVVLEDGEGPVVFTEDADEYLTNPQIELKLIDYLALNAWAQMAHDDAALRPEDFTKSLLAAPSRSCAAEYRASSLDQELGARNPDPVTRLVQCTRDERESQQANQRAWDSMTPVEREAHARVRLRMLWKAISPEYQMSTRAAFQAGVELNRENNQQFRRFAEEYRECEQYAENQAPILAKTKVGTPMRDRWQQINLTLRECAWSHTERMFPLRPVHPLETGPLEAGPQDGEPQDGESQDPGQRPP